MSVAFDGSLVVWAMRLCNDGIGSGASGSGDHSQAVATDDDDDGEVEDDHVECQCDGSMLYVKEGAHERGVTLILPWRV